jgi:hypothetical protein
VVKTLLNGLGAVATLVTLLVVGVTKFAEGAWIIVLLIPMWVAIFLKIRAHYQEVASELSLRGLPPSLKASPPARIVIPISGVHRGMINAVAFARSLTSNVTAVYVELDPGATEKIREVWERWWPDVPLIVMSSPYRSIVGPLLDFLDETDRLYNDGQQTTIVLPEFVPARWWQGLLHNQTAWLIKGALLYRRRQHGFQRVIIDVPYHLKK